MNSEQQKQSEQATTENNNKGEENKELNLEDEIAKADKMETELLQQMK